ncbi:MAG: Bug family tripartite tricarboxylate transporter substrate binding protein [Xanthobacteraceae bacterium]
MTSNRLTLPRRTFCGGLAATAGLIAASPFSSAGAQTYPSRRINVVIPTGQGGGAERLARSFDDGWSPLLKQKFEYAFYPGASGQIGYELFIKRRPHDGHNFLFGNMGPEMIMYVVQKPDYNFPRDYIYFSQVDADDSIIFARRDSPFKTAKQVVDAAKKKTLNVGVSRIPHPASIALLALGEATGSTYNLIPYGGGNPTYIAVLNGEVDIGALPISGVIALKDKFKVLGVFNRKENRYAALSENAPTINSVFGVNVPDLYSARAWAVHADWANKNPQHFELLEKTSKEAHASKAFREAYKKTGAPDTALLYGDRKACTEYAEATMKLAQKYEKVLSAKRGKKKKK